MEGSASAPTHPSIELEPPEWQPRALWVSARQLCGATAFFFVAFVFAYFYLRSLDTNRDWKIGHVHPSIGIPVIIIVILALSAVLMRAASRDPALTFRAGGAAVALALISVILQVIEWTTLGFGPASGGYASVYVGWTGCYAVFTLFSVYWMETQVATVWRRRSEGVEATPAHTLSDSATVSASIKACSFVWTFYVICGLLMFVILYLL